MKHRFFYNKRHVFVSRDSISGKPRIGSFDGDLMGGTLTFSVAVDGQEETIGTLYAPEMSIDLPAEGFITVELSGSTAEPESNVRSDLLVDVRDA